MKRIIIVLIMILSFTLVASSAMCEETSGKSGFVQWLRGIFHYPANVTNKTSEVVTEQTQKTVDTAAQTVNTTTDVVTGDVKKADQIITIPAQGTADVIKNTAEGVVNAPIDAAKESETNK